MSPLSLDTLYYVWNGANNIWLFITEISPIKSCPDSTKWNQFKKVTQHSVKVSLMRTPDIIILWNTAIIITILYLFSISIKLTHWCQSWDKLQVIIIFRTNSSWLLLGSLILTTPKRWMSISPIAQSVLCSRLSKPGLNLV